MVPLWRTIQSFFTAISRYAGKASPDGSPAMAVVALVRDGHDREVLKSIGMRDQLHIHFADSCREAWDATNRLNSPLVLCERDVPGIEWQDAVRILATAVPHPCVILTSRVVDEYLWTEIAARGGYDVLATPLRDADATRSIKLALHYWKNTSRGNARLPVFRK